MTLTEFLLERIGEDERRAHLALAGGPVARNGNGFQRRLRDAEAKRAVVERWRSVAAMNAAASRITTEGAWHEQGLFEAAVWMASAYSDHPDYQQEWRP